VQVLRQARPARRGFPAPAGRFLAAAALAAAAAAAATAAARPHGLRLGELIVLLLVAAFVQLFANHTAGNQVFHVGLAFTVAAALLLPPPLLVAVCIAQHLPEWMKQRYPWYIQTFNIVNYTLSALVAWTTWQLLAGGMGAGATTHLVAAALAAAAVFVLVNHLLLARMLWLARGRGLRESGLFATDSLLTDLLLACIGIGFAFSLRHQPPLAPVAALPIILIQRALLIPSLREQAHKDHKTGLLNALGLQRAAEAELTRAARFQRPLSVLLCDLDQLRLINNQHGHLAGDAALTAFADVCCTTLRDHDICGRFGGDEFIILLPETELAQALEIANRIQDALAQQQLHAHGHRFPLHASIGAATHQPGHTLHDLIAHADTNMYEQKRRRTTTTAAV
jgi:diguanylate cyclase (GGDEF)-like protein